MARVPPLRRLGEALRSGRLRRPRSRPRSGLFAFLALLGPGLIAANAGNDAGGVATYSSVGAKYGYDLLWVMVLITVSLAIVQRLAARMGAVTGKGLAELIRENYGIRWSAFATLAVLIANLGICMSDFVGIGAAAGLAGIPKQVSVPIAAIGIWLILVRGSYRIAERFFIVLTIPFFAYIIAALLGHPDWAKAGKSLVTPTIHSGSAYLLLLIAVAGTTITPYMQLYLQSAVVERGVRPEEAPREEREAVAGAIFADMIACFIIIATAATLFRPASTRSTRRPTRPRRSSRLPGSTPRRCSESGCSARACSRLRSCPSRPRTSCRSRWASRRASRTGRLMLPCSWA